MADAPVLKQFNDNLAVTQGNVLEVRSTVSSAVTKAKQVETALGAFEDIADTANSVASTISSLRTGVQLLEKVGPLKVVGRALKNALDRMESTAKSVRDKAREIDEKLEPSKQRVEEAREKLEDFRDDLTDAAIELGGYRASGESAESGLNALGNGPIERGLASGVDAVVTPPNAVVGKVNEAYAYARAQVSALDSAIDVASLNLALSMQADLARITADIGFLRRPLETIDSVLQPVRWALDAVDFVFDRVVSPVLDPVLDALGVNRLFDRISDRLNDLLPNVVDLDIAEGALDDALEKLLPDVGLDVALGVPDFLTTNTPGEYGALDFLNLALGDPRLILGTDAVDDELIGDGADNVISGGAGDDILRGNGGNDVFIGGAGNDAIFGDLASLNERAVFSGSLIEYLIEFSDDKRTVTVTHDDPANPFVSDGSDDVRDIEFFVFSDAELSRSALELGVQTTADAGSRNLSGVDDPLAGFRDFLFGTGETLSVTLSGGIGDDHLVGGQNGDFLFGGAGDDVLDGGVSGADNINGGVGSDTATFQSVASGGQRIDLGFVAGDRGAPLVAFTAQLSSIENVVGSNFNDIVLGADNGVEPERLSGEAGDDFLRGFEGGNRLEGGDGDDVIASESANDEVVGGDGADIILAGGLGGRTVDGGAGFDVLDYGGTQNAVISDFESGADGWTVINNANLSAPATGGNPGGFVQGTDSAGDTWRFNAPAKFLGDQGDKFGGSFSFDLKLTAGGAAVPNNTTEVEFSDGVRTIGVSIPLPNTSDFTHYEIALDDTTNWQGNVVTNDVIEQVLSNLASITIRGEYFTGADSAGLDNVVLSSTPLPPPTSSDFANGADGWRIAAISGDDVANAEFFDPTFAFGGFTGGRIQSNDIGGGTWYFAAPEAYLGDHSDLYGGTLSYDLRQLSGANSYNDQEIFLEGANLTLVREAGHPVLNNWTNFSIDIDDASGWTVLGGGAATEGQIRSVLSDVKALYIRGEYISGADSAALDNVAYRPAGSSISTEFQVEIQDVLTAAPLPASANRISVDVMAGEISHLNGVGDVLAVDEIAGVESIVGTAQDDIFLGALADAGGEIQLKGGAGGDSFQEGLGQQRIYGQDGDDTIVMHSSIFAANESFNGGDGTDTLDLRNVDDTRWQVNGGPSGVLSALLSVEDFDDAGASPSRAVISSFERVFGGDFDDLIVIDGFVDGGDGDDEIIGRGAVGGMYLGGDGNDLIRNFDGGQYTIDGGAGADVIATIGGFGGMNPTVLGGDGDDQIYYNGGEGSVDGGADVDLLSFGGGVQLGEVFTGVIVDLDANLAAGGAAGLTFSNIENLIGTNQNDQLSGGDEANLLVGLGGDDILRGRGDVSTPTLADNANDTLYGNRGQDTLEGGDGDDLLHGGADSDNIFGGDGADTASYVFFQEHAGDDDQITADLMGSVTVDLSAMAPVAIFNPTIAFEDFDGGPSGWFGDQIENNASAGAGTHLTEFLGGFTGNGDSDPPSLERFFDLGSHNGPVFVSFDFYEIGSWNGQTFMPSFDGDVIALSYRNIAEPAPEAARAGNFDGGSYSVTPVGRTTVDLGDGPQIVDIHRYDVTVTNPGGTLDLRFISQAFTPGRAGIDNLSITAAPVTDNLFDIENLVGGGLADTLTGDSGGNVISGGGGDDVIAGGGGADSLLDGFGSDTVSGEDGDDAIVAGGGSANGSDLGDVYDGGSGVDLLDYSGLSLGVTIDPTRAVFSKTYQYEKAVWADTETTEARFFGGSDVPALNPDEIDQALNAEKADAADDFFRSLSDVPGDPADQIVVQTVTVTVDDVATNFEKFMGSRGDDMFVATAGADDFDGGDPTPDDDDPPHPADDTISFELSTAGVAVDIAAGTFTGGFAAGGSYVDFSHIIGTDFDDTLNGDDGRNVINSGSGEDEIDARGGDDTVRILAGDKTVRLGAGNDTLTGDDSAAGSTATIFGGDGDDDVLYGGAGAVIEGGDGDDTLDFVLIVDFGPVRSSLHGDAGDDTLVVRHDLDLDGGSGNDTAVISASSQNAVTFNLITDEIIGFDDPNGFSNLDNVTLTNIENVTSNSGGSRTFIGDGGANILDGQRGGDTHFIGNNGDDILRSELQSSLTPADDIYDGGVGVDTVEFRGNTGVTVDLSAAGAQDTGHGMDQFIDIENVTGTSRDDNLTGDSGANVLNGGSAGNDDLNGGDGDDLLIAAIGGSFLDGGAGDDILRGHGFIMDGGADVDTAEILLDDALTIDLRIAAGQTTGASQGADRTAFIDIENLTTGAGADNLIGSDVDNIIRSGAGADDIATRFGSDTVFAGAGDDVIRHVEDVANRGDIDEWDGGDGIDHANYSEFHSAVQIDLTANHEAFTRDGTNVAAGVWRIIGQLENIENVTGTEFDDRLFGDAEDNILYGLGGNDRLTGGIGDDQLFGGDGNDVLFGAQNTDMLDGGDGNDRLFIDGVDTVVIGGDGFDWVSVLAGLPVNLDLSNTGIERVDGNNGDDIVYGGNVNDFAVILRGFRGDDTLTGGFLNDTLLGGDGADVLVGGVGVDRIYGQAGADSLDGGEGNDILFADSDDISIIGGAGRDVVVVQGGPGITLNVAAGSIERAAGSNSTTHGDMLSAAGATETVVLAGRDGDDVLIGGGVNDLLRGGDGNDVLNGGTGGNDRLLGGDGDGDIFEFNAGWGIDRIEDGFADNGIEKIRFDGVSDRGGGALDFGDLVITDNGGDAVIAVDGVGPHKVVILGFDHTRLDITDFEFV